MKALFALAVSIGLIREVRRWWIHRMDEEEQEENEKKMKREENVYSVSGQRL